MTTRSRIAQAAFDLAEPVVSQMGFDLVDVEYKKEGSAYFLRVYVDRQGGINIDDCEMVSKALDVIFEKSLSADPDYFEVSSPGLTRPLKTPRDFLRCVGEQIDVKFFQARDGVKNIVGVIAEVSEDKLILEAEGNQVEVLFPEIASAKRVIRF
ncbi:MAG: ribosome maturation factor RimP [Oscillospiraceae bacterium]|jgi:ribosome maturation factor RimP|nr:ribosome maturation factor RimP [Oscillospiraceae bacterium]